MTNFLEIVPKVFLQQRGYTIIDLDNLEAGSIQKFNLPYTYNYQNDEVVLDEDFEKWGDIKVQQKIGYMKVSKTVYAYKEPKEGLDGANYLLYKGKYFVTVLDKEEDKTFIEFPNEDRDWVENKDLAFII